MPKKNREYKDSLFVDLFYSDETAVANLLSLYNALHGTNLEDESTIQKVKIENVLYMRIKNDLSVLIDGTILELMEHQSTVNPNIPLRFLLYVARIYEQLVEAESRYRTTLVKIPTPEFFVFYCGKKDAPAEQELCLSDSFIEPSAENSLELKVTAININLDKGHERMHRERDTCRLSEKEKQ